MDGGLGLLGLGLFLLSIANLYVRGHWLLAVALMLASLVSMGYAFSESTRRREVSLGLGVALLLVALAALISGVGTWRWLSTAAFGAAFVLLWAEFRFPAFGNVPATSRPARTGRRRLLH